MNFGIYLVGYLILIGGIIYACNLAHVPQHWIVAIALILLGAGVFTGVQRTRTKDPS